MGENHLDNSDTNNNNTNTDTNTRPPIPVIDLTADDHLDTNNVCHNDSPTCHNPSSLQGGAGGTDATARKRRDNMIVSGIKKLFDEAMKLDVGNSEDPDDEALINALRQLVDKATAAPNTNVLNELKKMIAAHEGTNAGTAQPQPKAKAKAKAAAAAPAKTKTTPAPWARPPAATASTKPEAKEPPLPRFAFPPPHNTFLIAPDTLLNLLEEGEAPKKGILTLVQTADEAIKLRQFAKIHGLGDTIETALAIAMVGSAFSKAKADDFPGALVETRLYPLAEGPTELKLITLGKLWPPALPPATKLVKTMTIAPTVTSTLRVTVYKEFCTEA
jgi:hypothetical protein